MYLTDLQQQTASSNKTSSWKFQRTVTPALNTVMFIRQWPIKQWLYSLLLDTNQR